MDADRSDATTSIGRQADDRPPNRSEDEASKDDDRSEEDGRMQRSASGAPATGRAVRDVFSADETYQRLTATAEEEFRRTPRQLAFSGLGAGLALGTVFLGRASVAAGLGTPDLLWSNLLYPIGFIIVVLGRYQLYTENTLTPVTLVLTRVASLPALLRLWAIVFSANVAGAFAVALLLAFDGTLDQPITEMGAEIAAHAFEIPLLALFLRGIVAGALVGAMVWLTHAVREATARVWIIYGIFLLIPTAGLFHVITGFVEVVFGALLGEGSWSQAFAFLAAVGLGNTVGGVVLVALLNFGQTRERRVPRAEHFEILTWREWLVGHHVGLGDDKATHATAPELDEDHDPHHRPDHEQGPDQEHGQDQEHGPDQEHDQDVDEDQGQRHEPSGV